MRCPVCFSEQARFLRDLSTRQSAQHFVLREGDFARNRDLESHINKLWGDQKCSIRQCGQCEFVFSDPYIAGDETFYQLAYERSDYPKDKWEYRRTVEELFATNFHAKRVLELGAGNGFFLDKIADFFVPKSGITALEFNDSALDILRRKNYFSIKEDFRSAAFSGHFEAIFLFQVLEHMDNLESFFARSFQLLCDGGLLFIAVPNPKLIQFNEENGSLFDMPPNHIGRWSPKAFEIIGSRNGLNLKRLEIEPFSLKKFVRQDIINSYLRRSQQAGTLQNFARSIRSRKLGKFAGATMAAFTVPRRIEVWRKAAVAGDLGGCLWVEFTKKDR